MGFSFHLTNRAALSTTRIKTLFDASQVPDEKQIDKMIPAIDEMPLFGLLQDDVLVTSLASESEAFNRLKPA